MAKTPRERLMIDFDNQNNQTQKELSSRSVFKSNKEYTNALKDFKKTNPKDKKQKNKNKKINDELVKNIELTKLHTIKTRKKLKYLERIETKISAIKTLDEAINFKNKLMVIIEDFFLKDPAPVRRGAQEFTPSVPILPLFLRGVGPTVKGGTPDTYRTRQGVEVDNPRLPFAEDFNKIITLSNPKAGIKEIKTILSKLSDKERLNRNKLTYDYFNITWNSMLSIFFEFTGEVKNKDGSVEEDVLLDCDYKTDLLKIYHKIINRLKPMIEGKLYYSYPISSKRDYEHVEIAIDLEWKMTDELVNRLDKRQKLTERDLNNVLSIQFYGRSLDRDLQVRRIFINTSHERFTLDELKYQLWGICSSLAPAGTSSFQVNLITYFGGVDVSGVFGWEEFIREAIVIDKHKAFSTTPVVVTPNLPPITVPSGESQKPRMLVTLTDVSNLAPPGGLKVLGDIVGIPKLDTEVWDKEDNKPIGYYKEHMDDLLVNRPADYSDYAMYDAIITLKYYDLAIGIFEGSKTIGGRAVTKISTDMLDNSSSESIFDITTYRFKDVIKDPYSCIRRGMNELYFLSSEAFYGGHNMAYMSGYGHGRVLDMDLVSAYNIGGHLMPVPDFTDDRWTITDDIYNSLGGAVDSYNAVSSSYRFSGPIDSLFKVLKINPFILGCGEFIIDYPKNSVIVTPVRDSNGSPAYVRHFQSVLPLSDVYSALIQGATVKLVPGSYVYIPAQSFYGLTTYAKFQHENLVLKEKYKKDSKNKSLTEEQRKEFKAKSLLHKLLGNATYGKTGQGLKNKSGRDFATDEKTIMPVCAITNPVIASTYTSYTRLLVCLLMLSCKEYFNHFVPLNITTDGLTISIDPDEPFDINALLEIYYSKLPKYYRERLALAIDEDAQGFELKADCVDDYFNLKTRFNGTSNGELCALTGVKNEDTKSILKYLHEGKTILTNTSQRMSNLTDMKFRSKNKYGHLETWQQQVNATLGFDFAMKPTISHGNYFDCEHFETVEERDEYRKVATKLVKRFNLYNKKAFKHFIDTMNSLNENHFRNKTKHLFEPNNNTKKSDEELKREWDIYCLTHFAYAVKSGYTTEQDNLDIDLDSVVNILVDDYGVNKSSIKRKIRANYDKQVNYCCIDYVLQNFEF